MVFLRKTLYIILILLIANSQQLTANSQLPTEQEQQFTYYWYAARQAIDEQRYADAYILLEFCRALKPDDAQTLYFLSIDYQAINHPDQALDALEEAYRLQPKSQAIIERLLRIYLYREEWKKALKIQDESDRLFGFDAYSALNRYQIYSALRQPKKAVAAIDQYLETDPTNLRFLFFRLDLMENTGAKPQEFYDIYERILEADPGNLVILNNYAYLLAQHRKDLPKAERMSQQTIREQPYNPVYLDTYGWIMHLQGEDELALFYLQRALQNANEDTRKEIEKHIKALRAVK